MLPIMTFEGTVVADPDLRFTPGGKAVANLRVVANDRRQDATGTWADADPTFLDVTCWERLAENVAESVRKGALVVVVGKFRQRDWQDREGNRRTSYEIQANNVALSLRFRSATVNPDRPPTTASAAAPTTSGWPQSDEPPY